MATLAEDLITIIRDPQTPVLSGQFWNEAFACGCPATMLAETLDTYDSIPEAFKRDRAVSSVVHTILDQNYSSELELRKPGTDPTRTFYAHKMRDVLAAFEHSFDANVLAITNKQDCILNKQDTEMIDKLIAGIYWTPLTEYHKINKDGYRAS